MKSEIMSWAGKFSDKPYLEQFERMKRWYEVLKEISISNGPESQADYQVDCIYAFFMNCFHLKDWLISSGVISKNEVNSFINSNEEMKICRDLCNGSKHLNLNNPSIGRDDKCGCGWHGVTLHREYDPFYQTIESPKPLKKFNYVILADFERFNVFSLADKCFNLWEEFMNDNSLL